MQHPVLGEIKFIANNRLLRLSVHISADLLQVKLPANVSEQAAIQWLERNKAVILRKQAKIKEIEQNKMLVSPDNTIKTLTFTVLTKPSNRENIHFLYLNNVLHIEYPEHINPLNSRNQQIFWNGITYFLKKEARIILPARVHQLSELHGFKYNSVKIRSSKSRWGSCSSDKNINLSCYLLLLPSYLIDYVILHELCHTKEMNHSRNFWNLMNSVTNNLSKNLRADIKKYSMP